MQIRENITLSNIVVDDVNSAVYSLDMDNTAFEKSLNIEGAGTTKKIKTLISPASIDFKVTKSSNGTTETIDSSKYGFVLQCNSYTVDENTLQPISYQTNGMNEYIYNSIDVLFHGNTTHNYVYVYEYANPQPTQETFQENKYVKIDLELTTEIELTEETFLKNIYYNKINDQYVLAEIWDENLTYYQVFVLKAESWESGASYYTQKDLGYRAYLLPDNIQTDSFIYSNWNFYIQDIYDDSEVIYDEIREKYNFVGLKYLDDGDNTYYNNLPITKALVGRISEVEFNRLINEGITLYHRIGSTGENFEEQTNWDRENNKYYRDPDLEANIYPEKVQFYGTLKQFYINIGYSLREDSNDFKFYLVIDENNKNIQYGPYFASICWSSNQSAAKLAIGEYDITAAVTNNYLAFDETGINLYTTGPSGAGGLRIFKGTDRVFYADDQGNLQIKGIIEATGGSFRGELKAATGSFTGRLEAATGDFSGKIIASSGAIGGITINNGSISAGGTNGFEIKNDGSIIANKIKLGASATIADYIKLGNGYIYNPETHGGKFIEVAPDNETKLLINDNGTGSIGNITFNGDTSIIKGSNWELNPDTSIFNNVDISGTLTTSVFKKMTTQLAGSTFLFKTGIKFEDNLLSGIEFNDEFTVNTIFGDELTNNYLYCITNRNHSAQFYAKYIDNLFIALEDVPIVPVTDPYNLAIEFGQVNDDNEIEDWLIGINSTANNNNGLYPNGITFSSILKADETSEHPYNINPLILLGDLSPINKETYGLYAESAYLTGTLTTKYESSSGIRYAGINTLNSVNFNKNIEGLETDNSPIVIWAGANGDTDQDIQNARFQVTDNGTLYASQGYFSGTIITDANIQASQLTVDRIYGSSDSSSEGQKTALQIQDADVGIEFLGPDGTIVFSINQDNAFFNVPLSFGSAIRGNIFENAEGSFKHLVIREEEQDGTIYITPQFIYLNNEFTGDSELNNILYKIGNLENQLVFQKQNISIAQIDEYDANFSGKLKSDIGLLIGNQGEYRISNNNDGIDLYIYG